MLKEKDYIIEEVRNARERRAAKFKFDIDAIIADAKKRQKTSKHRGVSFVHKRKKNTIAKI